MAPSIPIIDAQVFFECQNILGEGILWDSKKQLLHWVDIDNAALHSLDVETMKHSVDKVPSSHLTAIVLRKDHDGFLALVKHQVVLLETSTPTSTSLKPEPKIVEYTKVLAEPLSGEHVSNIRFNDGGCDPVGRYFGGSMVYQGNEKRKGELWRFDLDGTETKLLDNIGVSNGIGWSPDGKIMYYVDSADNQVSAFDYDLSTGNISNRRVIADAPPNIDDSTLTQGVMDGLCMDGVGNIWVARWKDSRIVGYKPDGEIICFIRTKESKSPTIPCFGGKNLDTMYIATANANLAGDGDIQAQWPHSGDLFSVDFSERSEIRKLLGEGWKGAERHRYGA